MAKHIDPALKEEILRAIKDGMKISEAATKYQVSDNRPVAQYTLPLK